MLRFIFLFFVLNLWSSSAIWGSSSRYAQNSVLAEGRWVKIKVNETGIYKLTSADLKKMGFSNINKVSVFGYGGYMLNEDFSAKDYIDDLPEVATWKGNGDFILFYAKGTVRWKYDKEKGFIHERNPYSTSGYYFLRETDSPLRMNTRENITDAAAQRITTFDDYILHEKELASVYNSGRDLFGESFESKRTLDTTYQIPGITNDPGKIAFRFIAKAKSSEGVVRFSINDELQLTGRFLPNSDPYTAATERNIAGLVWEGAKNEATKINITYSGSSTDENVRLDYFTLQIKRQLRPYKPVVLFRSASSGSSNSRFVIQDGRADMLVFDVTDNERPQVVETSLNGSELSFLEKAQGMREYALVQPNAALPSPEVVGEVAPQNLHSLPQADYIIIAPKAFTLEAKRLAEEHNKRNGLTVHVVEPEAIYNEFSSGTPDATAYRRFMKMFYDRASSSADAPKYLLLFGDGSYDNRQLTSAWRSVDMSNFLLTFQSHNSLFTSSDSGSYITDDYFGYLEDTEGSDIAGASVDIGIGRFPVRTSIQAKNAVDKVIAYMDNKQYGPWKNTVTFLADDGNQQEKPTPFLKIHMEQADKLAEQILAKRPDIMAKKLYFDAHKKDNSNGGFATYPTIRSGLMQQLKEGTLVLNYTGHGSKDALSDEKILIQADINQFSYTNLPVWITATCDFTPFDDLLTSAGEDVFLNAKSGGIALFTTTRVAYAESNFNINSYLIDALFAQTNGVNPTLGDAIKQTKVRLGRRHQKLNFTLIGDPALRLQSPTASIRLTEINGKPVTDEPITISALQKVTIKGYVTDNNGNIDSEFNGEINPTIFDSQANITTLDNNKTGSTFRFTDYPNKLFMGNETVKNGEFEFTFTVPIDISYTGLSGKMSLYAYSPATGKEARGSFSNYKVWGTDGKIEDKEGPEIRMLYLNDSTFLDGGQVNSTPLLAVRIWDQTGVNITGSSIGHDITLVVDGMSSRTYNLNSYYKSISGSDGEGLLYFSIPELTVGTHTAELKVWDVLNNASDTTFTFEVVEGLTPKLYELTASPSPARESVTFYLYHNRPESNVKVDILVYDMMGRLQWRGQGQGTSSFGTPLTVEWNLQNGNGSRLRPGIYIYRAAISTKNSKEATDAKKLIILAQ